MASFEGFNSTASVKQRIGDLERDRATEYLREHMASGRLDATEFDERVEKALTAHFQSDLDQLFVDLPAPRPEPVSRAAVADYAEPQPSPEPVTEPVPARTDARPPSRPAAWNLVVGLAWVAAIALCVAGSWDLWWLIFIPLVMSGGCGRRQRHQRHLEHRQLHLQRLQQAHQLRTRGLR